MSRNIARALAAGALIGGIGLGAMLIAAIDWTWAALAYGTLAGATVFVIVFAWTWLRTGIEIDRAIEDMNAGIDVDRCYPCVLERCDRPATQVVNDYEPTLRACDQHAHLVRTWVGGETA